MIKLERPWRKSARSQVNGHCVDVAACRWPGGSVLIADTVEGEPGERRTTLEFPEKAWREFLDTVRR